MASQWRTVAGISGLTLMLVLALSFIGCEKQPPQPGPSQQQGQTPPQVQPTPTVQPSPQAEFTAQPTTGDAPLKVQFIDQSLRGPKSWSWDLGDGYKSSDQSPSHEYSKTGTYSVTLRVSNEGGTQEVTKQAHIKVSPGPIAKLELSSQRLEIVAGETATLSARVFDSSGNEISEIGFIWQATAGEIDSKGIFKAGNKAGSFADAITVRAGYKGASKDASASVNISPGPAAKIVIEPASAVIKAGEPYSFQAKVLDAYGNAVTDQSVTWQVAAGGGIISPDGKFTAGPKPGRYADTIAVSLSGTLGLEPAKATVTVAPATIVKIEVTPANAALELKGKQQFQAKALDQFGNEVPEARFQWKVDPAKGQVADSGAFTAGTMAGKFEGLIQVIATAEGKSATGTASISITPGSMARLALEPDKANLRIGGKQAFKAVVTDSYGNPLAQVDATWSLKAGGGEVDKNGVFLAGNKSGAFKDTLQARVVEKETVLMALSTITVLPDPMEKLEIAPKSVSIGIGMTQQFTAIATDGFGNKLSDVSFAWSVKDGGALDSKQLFTASEKGGTFADAVGVEAR